MFFLYKKMGFNFLGKEVKVVSKLGIFIEQKKKNEDEDIFLAVEQKQKSDRISFWRFFYLSKKSKIGENGETLFFCVD